MSEEKMSQSELFIEYAEEHGCSAEKETPSEHIKLKILKNCKREDLLNVLAYLSDNPDLPISSIDFPYWDLGSCILNMEGARHLANFLQNSRTVRVLNLEYTWAEEEGLEVIIDALATNTSVQDLNMENTYFTYRLGEKLLAIVQTQNTTLRQFAVDYKERNGFLDRTPNQHKPSAELFYKIRNQLYLHTLKAQNTLYNRKNFSDVFRGNRYFTPKEPPQITDQNANDSSTVKRMKQVFENSNLRHSILSFFGPKPIPGSDIQTVSSNNYLYDLRTFTTQLSFNPLVCALDRLATQQTMHALTLLTLAKSFSPTLITAFLTWNNNQSTADMNPADEKQDDSQNAESNPNSYRPPTMP